ncbi:P2X purinoceptor 4-like, partial [Tropilaelaps mercedesae]
MNLVDKDQSFTRQLISAMFEYQTLKIVNISNKKVGVFNRFLQLAILIYLFGYVIFHQKGYQQFSQFNSATTSKIKGVISTLNLNDSSFLPEVPLTQIYKRVWDVPDIVIPPSEADAFFLTTNLVLTSQSQQICPEDPSVPNIKCNSTEDCEKGHINLVGNGVQTGECVLAGPPFANISVCQIQGWCPFEVDRGPLANRKPLFAGVVNFTVLLKNYVEFPLFGIKLYSPVQDPHCPVFRIGDILEGARVDFEDISPRGGVIQIVIEWNCDFDYDTKHCFPTYKFLRIDDPEAVLARGWNFRYINKYGNGNRTLHKAYGITFRVTTQARAGKFYLVNLAMKIGSGLGLLAL